MAAAEAFNMRSQRAPTGEVGGPRSSRSFVGALPPARRMVRVSVLTLALLVVSYLPAVALIGGGGIDRRNTTREAVSHEARAASRAGQA